MKYIKTFENYELHRILIIVDVQRSFKKFFSEMYLNELNKYCKHFNTVYQIFDNHVDGKNVDKDYLYEDEPEIPIHDDLYYFPNQKDIIEKRYNYDVDADFYKKILSKDIYNEIKSLEKDKKLKKGDIFPTKEGTFIVYVGNNHRWHHIGKKLYDLLLSLKGRMVTIVGGSDGECLEDIYTAATSLGVKISRNWKYIYTATSCPIR